jgi:hypothetical protein
MIAPILALLKPRSVVDLGTATGSWLAAAKSFGVETVHGIDGPWVPSEQRHISDSEFTPADFESSLPDLGLFDLAISTEVLEHITSHASERAVQWLCNSAPAVLFSAAIPHQGGTHHINEAWPSHWAGLFKRFGFEAYDIIRPIIWADDGLPYWYRQNLLLMASPETGDKLGLTPSDPAFLDRVHPALYVDKVADIAKLRARSIKGRVRSILGMAAQ